MRSTTILNRLVVLSALCARADETPAEHWRVVVPDAALDPLAVSEETRLIAARGLWSRHVFHVLDRDAIRVVLSVHLARPIEGAAIAPDGTWFLVSTDEAIYRVGLADGRPAVLLQGAGGSVALDRTGHRLAVLGALGDDRDDRGFGATARLGIYDLQQGKWLAQSETPILVDHLVTFDGGDAVAAGRGGRVFHRAASSFACHVRLNPETGQTEIGWGPETGPGARQRDAINPDYAPPAVVRQSREALAAAEAEIHAVQDRLDPSGATLRRGDNFALAADNEHVVAVVDCGARQSSVLMIDGAGRVELRAAEIGYGGIAYCGGRLLTQQWDAERDPVVDLQSGKTAFTIPHLEAALGQEWVLFGAAGCLVRHGDGLEFYYPGERSRRWVREVPIGPGRSSPFAASPDARRLALGQGDSADLILILSSETGETVSRIARPMADGRFRGGYALAAAFSRDGEQLVIAFDGELRVHDVASGELRRSVALERHEVVWAASHLEEGWLLGSDDRSLFFDAERGRGATISLPRIDKVVPLRAAEATALLTETSVGRGAIVTPDGGVPRSWVLDLAHSVRRANAPPLSGVAFRGRCVARLTGTSAVELVDARSLSPIAMVHVLKLPDGFGWVAHTPDGYWDASPGAERRLEVFRDGRPAEAPPRRIESLLRERLRLQLDWPHG